MRYIPTIGLEIHAELKTRTKMFCSSINDGFETRPNVNICPVCLAHPGTLPVINREAVRHVLRVGVALGGKLADYSEFDRKNYFYPDLPKGYQISQYEYPLVSGGSLAGVAITRVHLEEDTASSVHDDHTNTTRIDYNRSGVPLMELVTEPVIRTAEEAARFGKELQMLLRYLQVSDANMEHGQMRLEANVSISDTDTLGTKVEIKNINSFNAMERAVAYEVKRQSEFLERGSVVVQETRGWDDAKQQTFSQRIKEGSADYRYFPDPDLPSLKVSEISELSQEELKGTLPELPSARRTRYTEWGIKSEDADQFVREPVLGSFFDQVVGNHRNEVEFILKASNYVANDLVNIIRGIESRDTENIVRIPISAVYFEKIINLILSKRISSRVAKDLISLTVSTGNDPEEIVSESGLFSDLHDDEALLSVIRQVIRDNPSVVGDFKAGKEAALEFLVGSCMRALRGAANATDIRAMLRSAIIE